MRCRFSFWRCCFSVGILRLVAFGIFGKLALVFGGETVEELVYFLKVGVGKCYS